METEYKTPLCKRMASRRWIDNNREEFNTKQRQKYYEKMQDEDYAEIQRKVALDRYYLKRGKEAELGIERKPRGRPRKIIL